MAEHTNVRHLTLLAGTGVRRTKAPGYRLLPDGREVAAFGLGFAARDAFFKGFDDADRRYFGDVEKLLTRCSWSLFNLCYSICWILFGT